MVVSCISTYRFGKKHLKRDKNEEKNAFSSQKIWSIQKNVVPLHRSPGNSSPRYDAGDESGFFVFMTELELLTSAFSAQRLNKYIAYNHGDADLAVRHYKSNLRLAESLYISLSVLR